MVRIRSISGRWRIFGWLCLFGGCTSDEWPPRQAAETSDQAGTAASDNFDELSLVVLEPQAASIHLLDEPISFAAQVLDINGMPVDDIEIEWTQTGTDAVLWPAGEGRVLFDSGIYDFSAIARLPDGSRLETQVGDVRVQSRWTGIYAGDAVLDLSLEFQGTPLNPRCTGSLEVQVDLDGSMVTIEPGRCAIDVTVLQLDTTFSIEGTFVDGVGQGEIVYTIAGLFDVPLAWQGAFFEDGFGGSYGGPVQLPLVGSAEASGQLLARLITRTITVEP